MLSEDFFDIVPLNDLFPHTMDRYKNCHCNPTMSAFEKEDGSYGVLVVHHSYDRREVYKRLNLLWPTYKGFGLHG